MDLTDAHIIVTGGASGLGAATAEYLVGQGAKVTIFDRNADLVAQTAARIGALAQKVDVTDEGACTAFDAAIAAQGPLRGLVNCAGIAVAGRILGREGVMPLGDFEKGISVNLVGTFNMMRLAAERMQHNTPDADGARGAMINTASVAAFDGQLGQCSYAASKGGIVSLSLPAARELARVGIRVNAIAPGVFMTPMLASLPQEVQDGIAATIPFPARLGDPREYAATVAHCLSCGYLNAEVIRLDGGVRLPPK